MKTKIRLNLLFLITNILIFMLVSFSAKSSDLAKEKRWADQITDSLMTGDSVWLKDGKSKFLGLYADSATAKTKGALIVVHGIGVHPNWPDVIQPIRSEMPEHDWATLSIQMPILENGKTSVDYVPLFKEVNGRFDAAVNYLKSKNIQNIVIVAHSLGTTMANHYLVNKPSPLVRGYISISSSSNPDYKELDNVKKITQITSIPMLDIYGDQDLDSVLRFSEARKRAGEKANKNYKQLSLKGADHFYQSTAPLLIKHTRLWLLKNTPGKKVNAVK